MSFKSAIANAKEENWERIQVDWSMLNFQFCLSIVLGYSKGLNVRLNQMSNSEIVSLVY